MTTGGLMGFGFAGRVTSIMAGCALCSATALSGISEIDLESVAEWGGESIADPSVMTEAFSDLVRQLGSSISNPMVLGADTVGIYGFEFGATTTVSLISSDGTALEPSSWERFHPEGEPGSILVLPRVYVRKGLPASIEVGGSIGPVLGSSPSVVGGYVRAAPLEGYSDMPDIVLQAGYSGFVGHDQLELGAMDLSGTIGFTIPFGRVVGVNSASVAPWVGAGRIQVHAQPNLSIDDALDLGLSPVSGFSSAASYDPQYQFWQVFGGMRISSGSLVFNIAANWIPDELVTLTTGMGLNY